MPNAADKLKRRLSGYWKMEAGNVLLLPVFLLFLSKGNLGWVSALCIIPMSVMLAIGAYYWRAKLKRLEHHSYRFSDAISLIARLQWPVLGLILIACLGLCFAWVTPGLFTGDWDKGAATFAAIMAVLEYVNYYHRQLQHFDHNEDFQRLLSGNGLRPSQMAKDLKIYHGR